MVRIKARRTGWGNQSTGKESGGKGSELVGNAPIRGICGVMRGGE
ncbi:MAG: hypothetical protein ABSH06_31155 [Thermodesulfobacteriota bacterium]